MSRSPFDPAWPDLPTVVPVFPLSGALLLPGGTLPLNIFEPRYLSLVEDALGAGRLMGMIQPSTTPDDDSEPPLYPVGCLGRIAAFQETGDGRLLISLTGLIRFRVREEMAPHNGYRRVRPAYDGFGDDLNEPPEVALDREKLLGLLKQYFEMEQINVDAETLEQAPNDVLLTSVAMLCPFDPREKQALLETSTVEERANTMIALLEMALRQGPAGSSNNPQ